MQPITAALFVAVFLFVSYLGGNLHAYLDPGTGSIALQLLMGGIVAALATVKLYWRRLRAFAARKRVEE
jgi:hypothetical protein